MGKSFREFWKKFSRLIKGPGSYKATENCEYMKVKKMSERERESSRGSSCRVVIAYSFAL